MDDEEREGESETNLKEGFPTTSVVTISSSKFRKFVTFKNEEQEEEENYEEEDEGGFSVPVFENQEASLNRIPEQLSRTTVLDGSGVPTLSVPTLVSYGSRSKQITIPLEVSTSEETVIEPERDPSQLTRSLIKSKSECKKADIDRELPFYYMELKRLRMTEKFDAFSDDEEPVLRTSYTPFVPKDPECPEPVIRKEKIVVYNVRKGEIPPKPTNKKHETNRDISLSNSTALTSRPSITRRSVRQLVSSTPLEWKFQDLTPHQRDLHNVSFEELSPVEVSVIKGLWKCITYDLWTFGALTTLNFFRIRGHIEFNDQKATPEQIMKCQFLWPHANQAMKSMEAVVLNLHKPEKSHKLVYELGRKHGRLKLPLSEIQSEMVVNSFLYTFCQHVHPKMTLKETNILRKFSNITMFLFMDASRWDREPLPLY